MLLDHGQRVHHVLLLRPLTLPHDIFNACSMVISCCCAALHGKYAGDACDMACMHQAGSSVFLLLLHTLKLSCLCCY